MSMEWIRYAFAVVAAMVAYPAICLAEPPPAVPPTGPLPFQVRVLMVVQLENALSQAIGAQLTITSLRSYKEQSGGTTTCIVGMSGKKSIRIVQSSSAPVLQPTKAQWTDAGCERPDYMLLR